MKFYIFALVVSFCSATETNINQMTYERASVRDDVDATRLNSLVRHSIPLGYRSRLLCSVHCSGFDSCRYFIQQESEPSECVLLIETSEDLSEITQLGPTDIVYMRRDTGRWVEGLHYERY